MKCGSKMLNILPRVDYNSAIAGPKPGAPKGEGGFPPGRASRDKTKQATKWWGEARSEKTELGCPP